MKCKGCEKNTDTRYGYCYVCAMLDPGAEAHVLKAAVRANRYKVGAGIREVVDGLFGHKAFKAENQEALRARWQRP